MKTKAKYEIEQGTSSDENRKEIFNIHLDVENKCLVATDGRILTIVPAEIVEGDISGPVSTEAFKFARKGITPKRKENGERIDIICKDKKLNVYNDKNGLTILQRPICGNYPNYQQVIPRNETSIKISFNPEFLMRIAKAIGSKDAITLEIKDGISPIEVYSANNDSEGFGVLMPMRQNKDESKCPDTKAIKVKYLK